MSGRAGDSVIAENEIGYQQIFDEAGVAIGITSLDGGFIHMNRLGLKTLGYSLAELQRLDFTCIIHPDDLQPEMASRKALVSFARSRSAMDKRLIKRDGSILWARLNMSIIHGLDGKTECLLVVMEDITEIRALQERLAKGENQLRCAMEGAGAGLWDRNLDTDEVYCSDKWREIFGFALDEPIPNQEQVIASIHPDDQERGRITLQQILAGQKNVLDIEYRYRRRDGRWMWVHSQGMVSQRDSAGRPVRMIGLAKDVTLRKRAEEELRKASAEAEALARSRDELMALVTHDLQSPLAAIIGLLRLSLDNWRQAEPEKLKTFVEKALDSSEKMMSLVRKLLGSHQLTLGRQAQLAFCNAHRVVSAALERLEQEASAKGVSLANLISMDRRIYAIEALLEEVIYNLALNSIKFCHPGGTVTVFTPDDGPSTIAVKDDGVGIKPGRLGSIFSFRKGGYTKGTADEAGFGLGLPLSLDIMRMMGGGLAVESSPGRGSLFYANLPHVRPLIMVVDDDEASLEMITYRLAPLDVDIVRFTGSEAALAWTMDNKPHLALCDIRMSGMDGFQLLAALRSRPATSSIPVIMMTSHGEREAREKALYMGASDFIAKPLDAGELIPRVRRFVW